VALVAGEPARGCSVLRESVPAVGALPVAVPGQAVPGEPVAGEPTLAAVSPGALADQAAEGSPASRNGANAPADNPEDADTLPARALRPGFARRDGEAVAGGAAAGGEAAASAPGEGSRGIPGMSQPGSVIARLPPPGQLAYLNRSHVRLYRPPVTFLEPLISDRLGSGDKNGITRARGGSGLSKSAASASPGG
jgi:hypothetical protein